jgi:hypothetical protein
MNPRKTPFLLLAYTLCLPLAAQAELTLRSVPVLHFYKKTGSLEIGYGTGDGVKVKDKFVIVPPEFFLKNSGDAVALAEVKATSPKRSYLRILKFCGPEVPISPGLEAAPEKSVAEFACEPQPDPHYADEESHYLIGYFALLNGDFPTCTRQLENAVDSSDPWVKRKAHLYLSDCQSLLGDKPAAAANLSQVDPAALDKADLAIYSRLQQVLGEDLERVHRYTLSISPYAGPVIYGSNSYISRGVIVGGKGSLAWDKWTVGAALEHDLYTFRDSTQSYSQNMMHGDVAKQVQENLRLKGGITAIDSTSNGHNVYALILNGNYVFREDMNATLGFSFSYYPKSLLAKITATELWADFNKRLVQGVKSSFWLKGTLEGVYPMATTKIDSSTGYQLQKLYLRLALQAFMLQDPFAIGLNGWLGKEALGVREEGLVIYNTLEDHTQGLGAFFSYLFSTKYSARISASREITHTVGSPIPESTYLGTFTARF